MEFEWHDKDYAWNKNRDLKAQEPFLSSAMNFYKESQSELKQLMLKGLDVIIDSLKKQDKNDANVQKAHKHGIESLYFVIYNMDYRYVRFLQSIHVKIAQSKVLFIYNSHFISHLNSHFLISRSGNSFLKNSHFSKKNFHFYLIESGN